MKLKSMKLVFLIDSISSFKKTQFGLSTNQLKLINNLEEEEKNNILNISFSKKDPLGESSDFINTSKGISPR